MSTMLSDDALPTAQARAGDLLYGAPAIAEFLGVGQQAVYHLIRKGRIPSFKIGKTVCARKSRINAALDELEAAG